MTDKILIDLSVVEKALTTLEGWGNYDKWVWPESALFTAKKNTAEMITALRAALEQSDIEIPASVPEGWKLVPVEPTNEMVQAWLDTYEGNIQTVYRAMLAAAPQPPVVEQPQVEQEQVVWAEEIIEYLHAHYDTETIKELDSGDALIRLDDAIAAVEEVAQRHAHPQSPRQPLTDEQKAAITRELNQARCLEKRVVGNIELTERIVRAVEAVHGIGE